LLEAAEEHGGQQSQCPYCSSLFVIPGGPVAAAELDAAPAADAPATTEELPRIATGGIPSDSGAAEEAGAAVDTPEESSAAEPPAERVVHIMCPNGHAIETQWSELGHDASCSICGAVVTLRFRDSCEYKEEQARREEALGRKALQWAIIAAAVVALGLAGMAVAWYVNRSS
jgi:ribosomal protein S27E